jgi:hypothetical protein
VTGDFPPISDLKAPLAQRIFIVTPRGNGVAPEVNQVLILIECKSTVNAIKSLLHSMSDSPIHAEQLPRRAAPARKGPSLALARLTMARPIDAIRATSHLLTACKSTDIPVSILGTYPGTEVYGG